MKKYGDVRRIIPAGSLGQCTYVGTWKDDVRFKCFDCNTKISFNPFGYYIKNLEPDWLVKIDCPICKANKND